MAKICGHCGAEMTDEAEVCGVCGVPFAEEAVPAQEQPIEATLATPAVEKKRGDFSLDKKFLPVIGVAAVAFIAVIVLLISLLFGGGYKSAVDNYLDVIVYGELSKIDDLAPKAYWDWRADEYDEDLEDIIDDCEDEIDDLRDAYADAYGDDIRVSYKIADKDLLSERKLAKLADVLHDLYDIKESSVKKAYDLEIDIVVKGSEDNGESAGSITVVKIGSDWYPVMVYEYTDEEVVVYFMGPWGF